MFFDEVTMVVRWVTMGIFGDWLVFTNVPPKIVTDIITIPIIISENRLP